MLRLDKCLADCGIASRRDIKKMIQKSRVWVDGVPEKNAACHVDPIGQVIMVDGQRLYWKQTFVFLLNKPRGVITATEDKKLPTVMDILPERMQRMNLVPVGRLDRDTEGLLLLTNDGVLAHTLLTPKKHVDKLYEAVLDKMPDLDAEKRFQEGLVLADGTVCRPAVLERVICGVPTACVTLVEGKFHQVKRMLQAVGSHVVALKRLRMGPIHLDEGMAPGAVRELSEKEVRLLYRDE